MDLTNKKCGVSLAGKNSLQNYVHRAKTGLPFLVVL